MDARELSARLPPPRDDEPPSLRQDILDELADHLQCALRRELLATGDAEAVRQRVIERFGDPGEVARKLWFQAMWSKIMSQRLMLGAMGVLTAVCLVFAGLTGWLIQQERVAAAQQQQVMAEMMERIARLAESKGHSGDANAVPATTASSIQVKLTLETPEGAPAKDHTVTLRQLGFDKGKSTSERSDSDGSADFGYCDPGRYEITIRTPSNFSSAAKRFVLHPSTAHVEHVVCPPASQEVKVAVVATLPEDLQRLGVQAFVNLNLGYWGNADQVWREGFGNRAIRDRVSRDRHSSHLLVRHDGWGDFLSLWEGLQQDLATGQQSWRWIISGHLVEASQHHILAGPRYAVFGLRLVRPDTARPFPGGPLDKAVRISEDRFEQIAPKPPADPAKGQPDPTTHPLDLEFVAEAGKLNEWVIPIPDELVEQAREYLKDHPPPSATDE